MKAFIYFTAGINRYPPPDIAKECKGMKPQETVKDVPQGPPNNLQLYQEPPNNLQLYVSQTCAILDIINGNFTYY